MSLNNKKNVYYIVSLVLTLLVFVAASTFAYFSVIASREKDSGCIFSFNANIDHPVQSCENVSKNILTT